MKYVASCLLLLIGVGSGAAAGDYRWPILRVVDGDTVAVDASADLPDDLAKLNVRLRGVDTPETTWRAKCDSERRAGAAAAAFTRSSIDRASEIVIRDPRWGKWGGRVVADLLLDGRSHADELISAGHGRPYDGGRRKSWC